MKNIFNQTELAELCGRAELISVRPGEFLFREENLAYALYIVKTGSLRIMSGSLVYETVTAGGIVGEMALIDEGAPRSASILAAAYAELWDRPVCDRDQDSARSLRSRGGQSRRSTNERRQPSRATRGRGWQSNPPGSGSSGASSQR